MVTNSAAASATDKLTYRPTTQARPRGAPARASSCPDPDPDCDHCEEDAAGAALAGIAAAGAAGCA